MPHLIGDNTTISIVKGQGYTFDEYNNRVKKDPEVITINALFSPIEDPLTISETETTSEEIGTLYIKNRNVIIDPSDTFIIDGVEWYQHSTPSAWSAPRGFKMNRGGLVIKIKKMEESNV